MLPLEFKAASDEERARYVLHDASEQEIQILHALLQRAPMVEPILVDNAARERVLAALMFAFPSATDEGVN